MVGRPGRTQRRLPLLAATAALVAACTGGPGAPTRGASAAPSPAGQSVGLGPSTITGVDDVPELVVARAICAQLQATMNRTTRRANEGLAGIRQATPSARATGLRNGYAGVIGVFERHAVAIEALQLPALPERDDLVAELASRSARAVDGLAAEAAAFEVEVDRTIADGEIRDQVHRFLNAVEKALAVSQPDISSRRSHTLRAAFALDESCEHVIPPFRLR